MSNVRMYGIPNCDTVKKTQLWLQQQKVAIVFHDYKKESITKSKLTEWSKKVGWEKLLNKKSTTWRGLDATAQASVTNQTTAIDLMATHTSLIKRPVVELEDGTVLVGFDATAYADYF